MSIFTKTEEDKEREQGRKDLKSRTTKVGQFIEIGT